MFQNAVPLVVRRFFVLGWSSPFVPQTIHRIVCLWHSPRQAHNLKVISSNLGPSLVLSAFGTRKASLALFVLALQEPFLTPRNQVSKRRTFIGAAFFDFGVVIRGF